jgi:hypothetical protein
MIEKIAISLNDIASFSVLLFLFLFTFTLLGLELFSGQVKVNAKGIVDMTSSVSPRPNFDDFIQGFVFIFMVLIGDNWPQYMWLHMLAVGEASAIFFVMLQIFGKYVLLNLFLAILLENFEEIESQQADETREETSLDTMASTDMTPLTRGRRRMLKKESSMWAIAKYGFTRCFKAMGVKSQRGTSKA